MDKYIQEALKITKMLEKEINFLIDELKQDKINEEELNKKLLNIKRDLLSIYFRIA